MEVIGLKAKNRLHWEAFKEAVRGNIVTDTTYIYNRILEVINMFGEYFLPWI